MIVVYIIKLDLNFKKTSIRVYKIYDSILKTYDITSAVLLFQDSLEKI